MISFDTLVAFAATALVLAFVPGPDNLFVLAQSALFGPRVGICVTLGLCTGLVFHTAAVSLGVAAIFQSSDLAFSALKIAGALYVTYLAYKAFRAKPDEPNNQAPNAIALRKMYLRGVVMNLTNPKIAIFFLALLPQFASPERGSIALQMVTLGGIFIVCGFACFCLISVLAGSLSGWLRRSSRSQIWLNRVAGTVFLGLAAKLATAHR